ncbi:hypothetical protein DSM109990_03526 (plasmid) [Sulfitobacter dubius]|uniref:Transposase n=1 Tax=Sulfitobacter dubius TaxID=218673 RepID=A0ABY3ZQW8_9RHOB|nr:hypothetical protein DSM109990_03526 [Sulfitobacter dubius]
MATLDVKPRIQSKGFLLDIIKATGCLRSIKHQVPAMARYRRWDEHKIMFSDKLVAKFLLSRAMDARHKPVSVRDIVYIENVDLRRINYASRSQNMRRSI